QGAFATVVDGALHIDNTTTFNGDNHNEFYFTKSAPGIDFASNFTFEARLRIRSSNFTGSRTGYYFFIFDSSNRGPNYVIQLASNGFSLGPDAQPFISR